MSVDEDFEAMLRREFLHQEPEVSPPADLPDRVVTDGIQAVKRRRTLLGIGTAVGVASLVAGVAVAVNVAAPPGAVPDPAKSPSGGISVERLSLTLWSESLPRGEPPEVAYVAGTIVYLPSGAVAELDVDDAGMVGQTVAGLVVLVEESTDKGEFSSRYVLIHDDGTTFDMATSAQVSDAQDELVSPDGRYFTSGGPVIDKSTGLTVGEMPEAADVLVSWTSVGIVYDAGGRDYLWRLGGDPMSIKGARAIYPNGTDIGIRGLGSGCAEVVRIESTGAVSRVGAGCVPELLSVSPDGARGLTTDLRVVDIETGETTPMSDVPLSHLDAFTDVHWLDDGRVLFAVPAANRKGGDPGENRARLLRCDTSELTCESATGALKVGGYRSVQLP